LLNLVLDDCNYDKDMRMSDIRHTKYWSSDTSALYVRNYENLVNFERNMKSYSDSRYARDQRRREGKWW